MSASGAKWISYFVVSGTIVSKVGDGAEQTSCRRCLVGTRGRNPSASRNASSIEPGTLLAIYVAPKSAAAGDLMTPLILARSLAIEPL